MSRYSRNMTEARVNMSSTAGNSRQTITTGSGKKILQKLKSDPSKEYGNTLFSDTSFSEVSLGKKLSIAKSFTKRVNVGTHSLDHEGSTTCWGPVVGKTTFAEDIEVTRKHSDMLYNPLYKKKVPTNIQLAGLIFILNYVKTRAFSITVQLRLLCCFICKFSHLQSVTSSELEILKSLISRFSIGAETNFRREMGYFKLRWHDFKISYRRWKSKSFELSVFNSYIKNMERNFGSGIGSLFIFIRWVLILNIVLSLLWIFFVIIPVTVVYDFRKVQLAFMFRNLIDGKGVMSELLIFYGSFKETDTRYHLPLAYLAMLLLTYFGSFSVILWSMAQAVQMQVKAPSGSRFKFARLCWSSWDYSVTSKEAAANLSKGITSAFKDNVHEDKAKEEVKKRDRWDKCKLIMLRLLAWFLTILLIGGGCGIIAVLVLYVSFRDVLEGNIEKNSASGNIFDIAEKSDFFTNFGTTIIFSLINILVPVFVAQLPKFERYTSGKEEMNITLTRIFFLRMANLFALITSIYSTVKSSKEIDCIGTVIGQELYKVVIMDTIVGTSVLLITSFGKYFWTRTKQEYSISKAVLVLVYRQGLIWTGTLACPVLPVVGTLSCLIYFFTVYWVIKKTCKPPTKRWNQSRNIMFFMVFLLATLGLLLMPISIIIGSEGIIKLGRTSEEKTHCGPFIGTPTEAFRHFRKDQPAWLKEFLDWCVADAVILPLVLVLVSLLIYQYGRINGERLHNRILKADLQQSVYTTHFWLMENRVDFLSTTDLGQLEELRSQTQIAQNIISKSEREDNKKMVNKLMNSNM